MDGGLISFNLKVSLAKLQSRRGTLIIQPFDRESSARIRSAIT
jgi:hypothetical protein